MHAADVIETLPTALPDDDILSAVQMVSRNGVPGLVVADERGELIGCMSSVDLHRAALPHHFPDDPGLTHVIDEGHADRIAAAMVGTPVRDVLTWGPPRIPRVEPQAPVVDRLLGLLATAAEGAS